MIDFLKRDPQMSLRFLVGMPVPVRDKAQGCDRIAATEFDDTAVPVIVVMLTWELEVMVALTNTFGPSLLGSVCGLYLTPRRRRSMSDIYPSARE